ncbi:MAG: DUF3732 domain-containing protein [Cytophagaceae bacterium]|jgi:hypothetical protein|nr:DUF3732 domain-containing protein [Cytophagaceae bacterium]
MNFFIENVVVWTKSLTKPVIVPLYDNKINVITGGNNTGKTSVLKIIDYCYFGRSNDIPDAINEQVSFYGIKLVINEKKFFLGRAPLNKYGGKTSEDFYFSDNGDIPEQSPEELKEYFLKEGDVKDYFEREYKITEEYDLIKVGTKIREGSKLKLEYFSIFNFISQSLILDENNFFDFQINNRDRDLFREALISIFDLCIGVNSTETYAIEKQLRVFTDKISTLSKKKLGEENRLKSQSDYIIKLISKAKKAEIFDDEINLENIVEALSILENRVGIRYSELKKLEPPKEIENLDNEKFYLRQRIRGLNQIKKEIQEFAAMQSEKEESLKPIEYLRNNVNLIESPEVSLILTSLRSELEQIKNNGFVPIDAKQIDEEIEFLATKLKDVETRIQQYPEKRAMIPFNERYIDLIEIKKDIEYLFNNKPKDISDSNLEKLVEEIRYYEDQINDLNQKSILIGDIDEVRRIKLEQLNQSIIRYYDQIRNQMGDYSNHQPFYSNKDLKINLLKAGDDKPTKISGSSNYLFLQLCLFLGLHETFIMKKKVKKDINFVPQFIVIDCPSLPYNSSTQVSDGDFNIKDSDRIKLQAAFRLLNDFIKYINTEYNENFQIIILEHINPEIWESISLDRFILSAEFRNGKALLNFNNN